MAPRPLGEDTRVTGTVRSLVALIGAVVVITTAVLGTWYNLSSKQERTQSVADQTKESVQEALQELKTLRSECDQMRPRVDALWSSHYGQQASSRTAASPAAITLP
jgi:ABC-type transporter Mla subunit MlaD